ncbi:MAG TPA: hypothetical protein VK866_10745 [Acidimicrobiales bacterium]|nr:hypothetical protein [Acidimicrobiales bacterium]
MPQSSMLDAPSGADRSSRRWLLRRVGAALAGVMAAVYYLIGAEVITVAEATAEAGEEEIDIGVFGVGAGTIFLVGALLLLLVDRRPIWAVGAALQVLIFVMYLAVSSDREPAFEPWGIALRAVEIPLLAVLVYLAVTPSDDTARSAPVPDQVPGSVSPR